MVLRSVGSSGQATVIMFIHWSGWCLYRYVCTQVKTQRIAVLRSLTQTVIGPWAFARPDREDVMFVVAGALKPQC